MRRATIYLKNVEDFKEVDARYAEAFVGSVKPARVAFGNNMIPKGALVEIDAIADGCDSNVSPAARLRAWCVQTGRRTVRRIPGNASLGGGRGVVPRRVPGNVALESSGGGPCHNSRPWHPKENRRRVRP